MKVGFFYRLRQLRNALIAAPSKRDLVVVTAYLTPEQAARGLMLFSNIENQELKDLDIEAQGYTDLSKIKVYG